MRHDDLWLASLRQPTDKDRLEAWSQLMAQVVREERARIIEGVEAVDYWEGITLGDLDAILRIVDPNRP